MCKLGLILSGLLFWSLSTKAQVCPNVSNLVVNCGFDSDINGYTPQLPGDVIVHAPIAGISGSGAMRVTDTNADGDTNAEAQICVNLGVSRSMNLNAQFRAINAEGCFLGHDEFNGVDCTSPTGNYVPSDPVAVNTNGYTSFGASKIVGPTIQSVELVILCQQSGNTSADFFVDEIGVLQPNLFSNSFE